MAQLQLAEPHAPRQRISWSGAAFIVESMLLLVFLVGSLAVFTQMFAKSSEMSTNSVNLSAAVVLAGNTAECFAATPTGVPEETQAGDLRVTCDVTPENRPGGTLYTAAINVYDANNNLLFTTTSARYVSGVSE